MEEIISFFKIKPGKKKVQRTRAKLVQLKQLRPICKDVLKSLLSLVFTLNDITFLWASVNDTLPSVRYRHNNLRETPELAALIDYMEHTVQTC